MKTSVPDLSVDIDLEIRKEGKEGLSPLTDISGTRPTYLIRLRPRPGVDPIRALRSPPPHGAAVACWAGGAG
jgi:hypothetical protein